MFYFRDELTGQMHSMYGVHAKLLPDEDTKTTLSWNRFLGIQNYLNVYNPSESEASIEFLVESFGQRSVRNTISVPSKGHRAVSLNSEAMGTSSDSLGIVTIEGAVIAELVRVGTSDSPVFGTRSTKSRSISTRAPFLRFTTSIDTGLLSTCRRCRMHQFSRCENGELVLVSGLHRNSDFDCDGYHHCGCSNAVRARGSSLSLEDLFRTILSSRYTDCDDTRKRD